MEILTENNELILVVEQSGLEKTKSQKLLEMFTPYFNRMSEIETKINGLNKTDPQKEDIKIAREIRLALKNNRVASEKVKDDSKAAILIEGRLIDNMNNIIKNTSKGLELQCEQIEKDAEIKEAARIEQIRLSRVELLSSYVEDANIFPLGTMSQDQFDTMLSGYKLAKEQKDAEQARLEAERLEREAAEKLRIEEQRLENERLRFEAAEKERVRTIRNNELRPFIIFIRDYNKMLSLEENEYQKELDEIKIGAEQHYKYEAEQQEKAAKERAENEAKLKAIADEAEKLQAELKRKQDAEKAEADRKAKEFADKIAADKKAAKAPVKEKLKIAINGLSLTLPESELSGSITTKFVGFKSWALQQIESL